MLAQRAGTAAPKYQAWVQRSDKPVGSYPYLLINRQICRMPRLEEVAAGLKQQKQTIMEVGNKLEGIVSGTKVFDPVIDNHRNMVFFEIEQTVQLNETGKVYGKCCAFPGKVGIAQLYFYTGAEDRGRSRDAFDSVLDSFVFEPGYDYEAGLGSEAPARHFDFPRVLIFGVIGGLLGPLFYRLLKARSPDSSPKLLGLRVVFALLIVLGGLELLLYPARGMLGLILVFGSILLGVGGLAASYLLKERNLHRPIEEELPPPPA
jgi:hypothetical protein